MIPARRTSKKSSRIAFTLVEMLVVVAIIATLAGLIYPSFSIMILRAQSVKCCANLHSIGVAASLAATDNNGQYPEINQNGSAAANAAADIQVYTNGAPGIVGALGTYGITTNLTQCPTDLQTSPCSFTLYGSSYEWNPVFDDEDTVTPILYLNANTKIPVNSSRVRLCTDFNPIHHNKMNAVYGDGHVIAR